MNYKIFRLSTILAMMFAFFTWGGWAYYINQDAANAAESAIVQGSYSGLMTLYMSFSVLFFYKKIKPERLFLLLPTIGTVGHTGTILVLVHYLYQTQNILVTVSVPLTIATAYSLFLTFQFDKERKMTNCQKDF